MLDTLDDLKSLYKANEKKINLLVKYIVMFFMFFSILKSDYSFSLFGFLNSNIIVMLVSAFLSAVVLSESSQLALFLVFMAVAVSLSSSFPTMLVATTILMLIFILYATLTKSGSMVMLLTIACFYLKIPFLIPVFIGINYKKRNTLPIFFGIISFYVIKASNNALLYFMQENQLPAFVDQITYLAYYLMDYTILNSTFIFLVISFISIAFICNYFSKSGANNGREISIVFSGGIFAVVLLVDVVLFGGSNLVFNLISIFVSMLVTYILCVFDCRYDYKSSEKVFFQDEDNVYYVKVVPKVK